MKVILLIEDLKEELEKATKMLIEKGYKVVPANNLEDAFRLWNKLESVLSGIITDLHFPEKPGRNADTACGFAVIARAVRFGVPISVCTSINHHFCDYLKSVITDLEGITDQIIPYTMDNKDWGMAIANLEKYI